MENHIYKAFDSSNIYRRLKGGSWYDSAEYCAVLFCSSNQATYANFNFGFRLVRTV